MDYGATTPSAQPTVALDFAPAVAVTPRKASRRTFGAAVVAGLMLVGVAAVSAHGLFGGRNGGDAHAADLAADAAHFVAAAEPLPTQAPVSMVSTGKPTLALIMASPKPTPPGHVVLPSDAVKAPAPAPMAKKSSGSSSSDSKSSGKSSGDKSSSDNSDDGNDSTAASRKSSKSSGGKSSGGKSSGGKSSGGKSSGGKSSSSSGDDDHATPSRSGTPSTSSDLTPRPTDHTPRPTDHTPRPTITPKPTHHPTNHSPRPTDHTPRPSLTWKPTRGRPTHKPTFDVTRKPTRHPSPQPTATRSPSATDKPTHRPSVSPPVMQSQGGASRPGDKQ